MAIDLTHGDGRDLLARLLASADVFATNIRADARARLRIDVDDVRADNPAIVYVRGTAFGARGADAGSVAVDMARVFATDAADRISRAARQVVRRLSAGGGESEHADLIAPLATYPGVDAVAPRRRIAEAVIAAGRHPF